MTLNIMTRQSNTGLPGCRPKLHSRCEIILFILFIASSAIITIVSCDNSPDRPASTVAVSLYAKWRYTPVHIEASEILASEEEDYFWNYIRIIHERFNSTRPIRSLNYAQQYNEVVDIAEEILDDAYQNPLFKFALAHRVSSPAIAAHEQIARDRLGSKLDDCKAFIEFPQPPITDDQDETIDESRNAKDPYGTKKPHSDVNILCNAEDAALIFEKIMSTPDYIKLYYQPTIYKTDHIYYAHNNPKGKKFGIMTAILYGEIGSQDFIDLYEFSKSMADMGKMNFVVRHLTLADKSGTKHRVALGGYGVELAIKSTEYKAQDDTRVKGEASNLGDEIFSTGEKPDEIEDLVLKELAEAGWSPTNPMFHEQILESIKQIPHINSSDIEDLSTQAVSLIMTAPLERRLALMRDLSHNFPILAKSLSDEVVDKELQAELEQNQLLFARFINVAPTEAALFMNGYFFDVDALDMFALFEVMKKQYKGPQPTTDTEVERFLERRYADKHSGFVIPPEKPDEKFLKMLVILDPLTRGAQKILPILMTFRKIFNLRLRFMFNCVDRHTELPLKNFYRFVIENEPNFKNGPDQPPVLRTVFRNLPSSSLFTLNMATPENWLVESVRTPYDLDNIHLAELPSDKVWAEFELEHLLLEGHCFDITNGSPPRGLQFVLGTRSNPTPFDTIVMANLGYFQLKASPGAWNLRLRHGKSAEIYTIFHVEGADFIKYEDPKYKSDSMIPSLINDFRSRLIKVKVHKKKDQRHRDLLQDDDGDDNQLGDIWGTIRNSVWSGGSGGDVQAETKESGIRLTRTTESNRINIFSLASGHLYERLLRIMMLSVLKNTNTPVKFWFLKNYLSPSFKDFLPYYAEKYNFDYELVQYKWPRWLHQQTEKQRIIWGYKILFLDVLFPLDVKKIIFVDADQIVRADLTELRDLDLEGAPYGYTPFCDSRTDMDGFRFWKTGYWNSHLHGRKYHISALYVVDLVKFRKIAAGDRLRGQYQGLSQDPNSLSNLDQDLPNNMIHQVAIKSLPQEWLWCETWCSDEEKERAKTIDLCNNPKTKEPKLTSARRIVKEWVDYDEEIKAIYNEYLKSQNGKQLSSQDNLVPISDHSPSADQKHAKDRLSDSPTTESPSKSDASVSEQHEHNEL
jgi:lipopolysaccharide biosynthesis glycosyltransferase